MVSRNYLVNSLLYCVCALFATQALAANITARLDRNPVLLDESFHLIYEADSDVDDPDFSVLSKDFDILNSSQSTNMRAVNGNWSLKKTWDLALISKEAGVFTIPSISFGNDISPALRVTVNQSRSATAPQKPGDPGANVFIEVETNVKQAWLQSQIIYTIRLFSNIPVGRPTLSQPETDNPDTIFFKLGEVNNYEAFRQGERYAVSELKFAAFAQHSGELTFKPVLFEGLIADSRPRSLFDSFNQRGTVKRLRSEPITVRIKPIPAGQNAAQWLPASELSLVEEWSDDISQLNAGEPVTRTITLVAKGLTAEQLPTLKADEVTGLKQYADQATTNNENSASGVTGTRIMKTALIPGHSGDYQLPALTVRWWNTSTGRAEVASLPARKLQVSGVANILANPPANTSSAKTPAATTTPAETSSVALPATPDPGYWRWLSLALATAWLLTIVLFLWLRRRPLRGADKPASLGHCVRAVLQHCASNQASKSRDALLAWARIRWPDRHIANLAEVAQACTPELGAAIRKLNSALYSATPQHWQGQELAAAFKLQQDASSRNQPPPVSSLEPLYK